MKNFQNFRIVYIILIYLVGVRPLVLTGDTDATTLSVYSELINTVLNQRYDYLPNLKNVVNFFIFIILVKNSRLVKKIWLKVPNYSPNWTYFFSFVGNSGLFFQIIIPALVWSLGHIFIQMSTITKKTKWVNFTFQN